MAFFPDCGAWSFMDDGKGEKSQFRVYDTIFIYHFVAIWFRSFLSLSLSSIMGGETEEDAQGDERV